MNPAKLHFWQMTGIFALLVVLVLGFQQHNYRTGEQNMMTQMMGQSMGSMMRMMHASDITLVQLLTWQSEEGAVAGLKQSAATGTQWVHQFTTDVVFLLLPFVMAGTALLLVIWLSSG